MSNIKKQFCYEKKGYSYSEIATKLSVSNASLSFWLRDVKLTHSQIDNLLLKKKKGQEKGAKARKDARELKQRSIIDAAAIEIDKLSKKELFLMGYSCLLVRRSQAKDT